MSKTTKNAKLSIRTGDTVQVISGKDKGTTGKVIKVDRVAMRVLVEGVNMVQRHTKANQHNQQGGIISQEAPIHYSNVLLYNPALKRGVRTKVDQSSPEAKKRLCVKTNNIL